MSYLVRPVTFRDYGVYKTIGENRAEIVFEGTETECYRQLRKLQWDYGFERVIGFSKSECVKGE